MTDLPLMLIVGVLLTAIAVAGAVAERLGQSVIPAYILTGVLLGPGVPRSLGPLPTTVVTPSEFIDVFAELGIVILLFFLGLHIDVEELVSKPREILASGTIDLLVNFTAGLVLAFVFGFTLFEALFIAGIVYISSSAIITKALIDSGWVVEPESEPILGTLVFEDLFVAVYLTLLGAVSLGTGSPANIAFNVVNGLVFLGIIAILGGKFSGVVEKAFAVGSSELFLLRVVGLTALLAGFAVVLDVSEAVTAFIVGASLGLTDHEARIERLAKPVRDLFAAVFFFSIGLSVGLDSLFTHWKLLGVAFALTTASKLVSGLLSGWIYGLGDRRSIRVGIGLVPRGEFSLVLAGIAQAVGTGALATTVPEFAVGYVLVMSITGTLAMRYESRIDDLLPTRATPADANPVDDRYAPTDD